MGGWWDALLCKSTHPEHISADSIQSLYIYISLFPSFFFCELLWKILSALHVITLHLRHRLKLWRLVNLIHLIWESSGRVAVQTIKKHNHISLSPLPKNKLASPPFVVSAGLPPIAPFAKIKRSSLQQAKLFQMWWLTLAVRVDVDTGEKMKNGDRFPLKLGVKPPPPLSRDSRAVQPRYCKSPDYIQNDGKQTRHVGEREIIFITMCFTLSHRWEHQQGKTWLLFQMQHLCWINI